MRTRAIDALTRVGIASAADRLASYPHQLSGGMRQRVAIAIALLNEPDLVICDEPTTALDVTIQAQILATMQSLIAASGLSLIWITHDLTVLAGLADRVAVDVRRPHRRVRHDRRSDRIAAASVHARTDRLVTGGGGKKSSRNASSRGHSRAHRRRSPTCRQAVRSGLVAARRKRTAATIHRTSWDASGRTFRCFHPVTEEAAA